MRVIISPAKQMVRDDTIMAPESTPVFLAQAEEIAAYMQGLSYDQAKKLWGCSDKIAEEAYEWFSAMDLTCALTPAILAYDGIAFKYMAPRVFEDGQFNYVADHLRILSGFYGALRALDGVVPYRLEMQAKAKVAGMRDLYAYWGDQIYQEVQRENDDRVIVNLASKEYSKCIEKYLTPQDTYLTCVFGELAGDKVVQKGVYAKMARGEMVRYMAQTNASCPDDLMGFNRLDYVFSQDLSDEVTYVFVR